MKDGRGRQEGAGLRPWCRSCGNTRFIPGPMKERLGYAYTTVQRCPDCGPKEQARELQPAGPGRLVDVGAHRLQPVGPRKLDHAERAAGERLD